MELLLPFQHIFSKFISFFIDPLHTYNIPNIYEIINAFYYIYKVF